MGTLGNNTTTDRPVRAGAGDGEDERGCRRCVPGTAGREGRWRRTRTWGWNTHGQLGDSTATTRLSPVQVPGLSGVVAVSAGLLSRVAVEANGTVWTWGWNGVRPLGLCEAPPASTEASQGAGPGQRAVGGGSAASTPWRPPRRATSSRGEGDTKGQLGFGTAADRRSPPHDRSHRRGHRRHAGGGGHAGQASSWARPER